MATKRDAAKKFAALNRKASRDYAIEEEFEAGLVLLGTEVKSLRQGRGNLDESYAGQKGGELWLFNVYIPEYSGGNRFNHEPRRARKLLMHRRQIEKLLGQIKMKGMTLVPLSLYFNKNGFAKVKLGLARGKKEYEKRDTIKKRDWQRQKERLMKRR